MVRLMKKKAIASRNQLTVRSAIDPSTMVFVAGFMPMDPEQNTRPL
jgi:hypothetical protein